MLVRLIGHSIEHRFLVIIAMLAVIVIGVFSFTRLPIDAVPDITNVQVQINTSVPALSPLEVEQQITFPIEWAMGGMPKVEQIRSISRFGLSQVTVVFEDGTDIYWARQLVGERLTEARESLPEGLADPQMGPISTGLGEIYMWSVESVGPKPDGTAYSPQDLREVQDWIIRPQLRTVAGVTEINSIGGYEKQYHVTPDPAQLVAYGLGFHDVVEAIAANNANAGGGYIEHVGEAYLVRATGLITSIEDIQEIVLKSEDGVPIRIRDVASVAIGKELRTGAGTAEGQEVVIGTAMMLLGANSRTVASAVDDRMAEINKTLPTNIIARTLYDRTYLVDATLGTVRENLTLGAVLVIIILFIFLGNLRAAFIVALVIPFAMMFAITAMVYNEVPGNLMSLGAIDFGIIVDGAVIITENILRRLAKQQSKTGTVLTLEERKNVVLQGAAQVARPTLFGMAIIMIVLVPILTLTGIEGKMFGPMAVVLLLVLAGAAILTFTGVPAMCATLLRGRLSERENLLIRWLTSLYRPVLAAATHWKWATIAGAGAILAISVWMAGTLGGVFVPELGEGALAIQPARIPSIALTTSVQMQKHLEERLKEEFPDEIVAIFARTGTAEVATDPMGPNVSDTYLMLHPRSQWTRAKTQEQLAEKIEEFLQSIPGQNYEISQPIELRFNELISGIRSDVAVKIYGDDMEQLLNAGTTIAGLLQTLDGAADVKVEQVTGLSVLTIDTDRAAIARYGLNVSDVQQAVRIAFGGEEAGILFDGDRRFPIVVRIPDHLRENLDSLRQLPIPLPDLDTVQSTSIDEAMTSGGGGVRYLPLEALAQIYLAEGPNQISRENAKRRLVVQVNVRGRDIASFVSDAQLALDEQLELPEGYWIEWGGQFENLIAARQRLMIVVPAALFLIFVLLFMTFGSARDALLVFTGVPLALTGGVIALWLWDMPFSISAGIGFIALSGVSVLNGLVLVSFIRELLKEGASLHNAVINGSLARFRQIVTVGLVASLGFVPMALNTGMGAEVQRPLATVVIGGLISSTLLTLIVLPTLYLWLGSPRIEGDTDQRGSTELANGVSVG